LVLIRFFLSVMLRNHGGVFPTISIGYGEEVGGQNPPFVANVTSYLVTFIRLVQNLYFICSL